MQALQLCHLVVWMVKRSRIQDMYECQHLFAVAASLLDRAHHHHDTMRQSHIADMCLYRIHLEETSTSAFTEATHDALGQDVVLYNDELVRAIARFYTGKHSSYWPVRRLSRSVEAPFTSLSRPTKLARVRSSSPEMTFYETTIWTRQCKALLPFVLEEHCARSVPALSEAASLERDKFHLNL